MSYKPAVTGVPQGIVYFGNPAADNMFEAESNFTYDASTDKLIVDNIQVSNDVTILGDLDVSGVINQINLEELLIEDQKIVLNSNYNSNTEPTVDAAIIVNRGPNTSSHKDVEILWNEGSNIWTFTNDGSTYYNLLGIQSITDGDGLTNSGTTIDPIFDVDPDNVTIEIDGNTKVAVKDGGIDTDQLADDSVNGDKIADDSIDSEHYVDGSIDTAHLSDGAVTEAKRSRTITEVTADATVAHDVTLVTTSTTNRTITLPTATNGKVVVIKKIDSGSGQVIIQGASHDSTTDRIDGSASTTPRLYYVNESITCIAKNTGTSTQQQDWYII
jgi:hypothetical protein